MKFAGLWLPDKPSAKTPPAWRMVSATKSTACDADSMPTSDVEDASQRSRRKHVAQLCDDEKSCCAKVGYTLPDTRPDRPRSQTRLVPFCASHEPIALPRPPMPPTIIETEPHVVCERGRCALRRTTFPICVACDICRRARAVFEMDCVTPRGGCSTPAWNKVDKLASSR